MTYHTTLSQKKGENSIIILETENEMVEFIMDSMDMSLNKLQETLVDREAWCAALHGIAKHRQDLVTEQHPQWVFHGCLFTYSTSFHFHVIV